MPLASAIFAATLPLLPQSPASSPPADGGYRVSVGGVEIRVTGSVPTGPVPRLADRTPDLSGVWLGGGPIADISLALAPGETIPILPEARQLMASRRAQNDPQANCLPSGVPRTNPYPWRIVQHPTHKPATHIFILYEGNIHSYRQIFMDGRKHPDDLDPTWYGHSIGTWDGDTLVIDTVGYNDKFWFDFRGTPHTERLHTIERLTRHDVGHMVNEVTIDDPGAYSRPWTVTFRVLLMPPNSELLEYICQENNLDPAHMSGPAIPPGPPR
jgi:hypothetical protein